MGPQDAAAMLPPCDDLLGTIAQAWRSEGEDWRLGVARAACVAAGASEAGVETGSDARPDGIAVATGAALEPEGRALLARLFSEGKPCAVWSRGDDVSVAAAAIGRGTFVWARRAPPFDWREALALRHVAAIAAPLVALDRQRAEAELRLEELRHRCGNDLQLTASLLGFHARHTRSVKARATLTASAEQIVALAHARRMPENDLAAALRGHCAALAALAGARGVVLTLTVAGDLPPVTRLRAGLVLIAVNEIVTNALKHAFPDRRDGTVRVIAAAGDGHLDVRVDDDGVAMPPDACARAGSGLDLVARLLAGGRGALAMPEEGRKHFVIKVPTS